MKVVLADVGQDALTGAEKINCLGRNRTAGLTDVSKADQVEALARKQLIHSGCTSPLQQSGVAADVQFGNAVWPTGIGLLALTSGSAERYSYICTIMLSQDTEGHVVNSFNRRYPALPSGASYHVTKTPSWLCLKIYTDPWGTGRKN